LSVELVLLSYRLIAFYFGRGIVVIRIYKDENLLLIGCFVDQCEVTVEWCILFVRRL